MQVCKNIDGRYYSGRHQLQNYNNNVVPQFAMAIFQNNACVLTYMYFYINDINVPTYRRTIMKTRCIYDLIRNFILFAPTVEVLMSEYDSY